MSKKKIATENYFGFKPGEGNSDKKTLVLFFVSKELELEIRKSVFGDSLSFQIDEGVVSDYEIPAQEYGVVFLDKLLSLKIGKKTKRVLIFCETSRYVETFTHLCEHNEFPQSRIFLIKQNDKEKKEEAKEEYEPDYNIVFSLLMIKEIRLHQREMKAKKKTKKEIPARILNDINALDMKTVSEIQKQIKTIEVKIAKEKIASLKGHAAEHDTEYDKIEKSVYEFLDNESDFVLHPMLSAIKKIETDKALDENGVHKFNEFLERCLKFKTELCYLKTQDQKTLELYKKYLIKKMTEGNFLDEFKKIKNHSNNYVHFYAGRLDDVLLLNVGFLRLITPETLIEFASGEKKLKALLPERMILKCPNIYYHLLQFPESGIFHLAYDPLGYGAFLKEYYDEFAQEEFPGLKLLFPKNTKSREFSMCKDPIVLRNWLTRGIDANNTALFEDFANLMLTQLVLHFYTLNQNQNQNEFVASGGSTDESKPKLGLQIFDFYGTLKPFENFHSVFWKIIENHNKDYYGSGKDSYLKLGWMNSDKYDQVVKKKELQALLNNFWNYLKGKGNYELLEEYLKKENNSSNKNFLFGHDKGISAIFEEKKDGYMTIDVNGQVKKFSNDDFNSTFSPHALFSPHAFFDFATKESKNGVEKKEEMQIEAIKQEESDDDNVDVWGEFD